MCTCPFTQFQTQNRPATMGSVFFNHTGVLFYSHSTNFLKYIYTHTQSFRSKSARDWASFPPWQSLFYHLSLFALTYYNYLPVWVLSGSSSKEHNRWGTQVPGYSWLLGFTILCSWWPVSCWGTFRLSLNCWFSQLC